LIVLVVTPEDAEAGTFLLLLVAAPHPTLVLFALNQELP